MMTIITWNMSGASKEASSKVVEAWHEFVLVVDGQLIIFFYGACFYIREETRANAAFGSAIFFWERSCI